MLAELDYDNICYFVGASETPSRSWDDVPRTSGGLLIAWAFPRRNGSSSRGVGAQYESEVVYHLTRASLISQKR